MTEQWLVTWLGNHIQTVDGRVIETRSMEEYPSHELAHNRAMELSQNKSNHFVKVWLFNESYPYFAGGAATVVEDM